MVQRYRRRKSKKDMREGEIDDLDAQEKVERRQFAVCGHVGVKRCIEFNLLQNSAV